MDGTTCRRRHPGAARGSVAGGAAAPSGMAGRQTARRARVCHTPVIIGHNEYVQQTANRAEEKLFVDAASCGVESTHGRSAARRRRGLVVDHIVAHTHTYVHRITQICTHICTHTCTHICTHMYTAVHICTHIYTQMYTDVHTCTHMYTHVHTCTHMYTHTCTHMYVHTCTHTHVNTRTHM